MLEIELANEAELEALGARLATAARSGGLVYLRGELGAGKTTLVRGWLRGLGHRGAVKSPTYTLVESYLLCELHVYHFDLYRLIDVEELEYIGLRDYLSEDSLLLIEWPERGAGILPGPDLDIHIQYARAGRRVSLQALTETGELWLSKFTALS